MVHYINLPVDDIKRYAVSAINAGLPVWFACDVSKYQLRTKGVLGTELIDNKTAFNFSASTTEAERLKYGGQEDREFMGAVAMETSGAWR
ncbi:bleomycin hydrolase [Coemansia sp. RSA 2673]|nr:bleomycin hydrolase [Coemansia sp. RSA 2673]